MRALTSVFVTAFLTTAAAEAGPFDMASNANPEFAALRYPDMGLYKRQSPGGCHGNTVPCSNFCIAQGEECCADGTSCELNEKCQRDAKGNIGCCPVGAVCPGAAPSQAPATTSSASSSSNLARRTAVPIPPAAAAVMAAGAVALF